MTSDHPKHVLIGYSHTVKAEGLLVTATVANVWRTDQIYTAELQFSFRDQTVAYSVNHTDDGNQLKEAVDATIAREIRKMARHFRGVGSPPVRVLGAKLMASSTTWLDCNAVFCPDNDLTLVEEGFAQHLALKSTKEHTTVTGKDGRTNEVPVYRLTVDVGGHIIETEVALTAMQLPCALGRRIMTHLLERDSKYYYFLHYPSAYLDTALQAGALTKESTLLLLGSYKDEQRYALEGMRAELFRLGYRAILLSDFPDVSDHTLEEKLLLLGALSKGVIVVDDNPSGHLVEITICTRAGFATALLVPEQKAHGSTSMIADLELRYRLFRRWLIKTDVLEDAVSWIERSRKQKAAALRGQYPWRRE